MKFSTKCVIAMGVFLALFVVTMIVVYCITGGVPDSLVYSVFSAMGLEAGVLGVIKNGDQKYGMEPPEVPVVNEIGFRLNDKGEDLSGN